jgi:hypothetical protein
MRNRFTFAGVGVAAAFLLGVVELLTPSVACGQEGGRTKIGTSGPKTGTEFVDKDLPKGAKVIGVKIRSGDWIDAVELLYKTADGKVESLRSVKRLPTCFVENLQLHKEARCCR